MANFYGAGRTNFFKVKDPAFFKRFFTGEFEEHEGQFFLVGDEETGELGFYVDEGSHYDVHIKSASFTGRLVMEGDDALDPSQAEAVFKKEIEMFFKNAMRGEKVEVVSVDALTEGEGFSSMDAIAPYLEEDEVVVSFEVGNEKLRYLHGMSMAVHSSGKQTYVDLNTIYEQASREFNLPVDSIARAEYEHAISHQAKSQLISAHTESCQPPSDSASDASVAKVMVACAHDDGTPALVQISVHATEEEQSAGKHYDRCLYAASSQGYDISKAICYGDKEQHIITAAAEEISNNKSNISQSISESKFP